MKEQIKEKAKQIAEKYVYGQHDALTDRQEVKDMTKDILDLLSLAPSVTDDTEHRLLNNLNVDGLRHIRDRFEEAKKRREDLIERAKKSR